MLLERSSWFAMRTKARDEATTWSAARVSPISVIVMPSRMVTGTEVDSSPAPS